MTPIQSYAAPVGRLMLSLIFIVSGFGKIGAYSGTQAYMESMGVPGALLPAVIAFELLAGAALVLGWHARIAAFLMAGFSILSAAIFHAEFSDPMQQIMFLKNLGLAGGFLMIVALGPGPWSLDERRKD